MSSLRLLPLLLLALPACVEVPFDVVILNGLVVDGTGSEGMVTDVGIRGDRIAEVGALGDAPALQVVDAHGMVVAPGFLDLQVRRDEGVVEGEGSGVRSPPLQGVTTVLLRGAGWNATDLEGQRSALLEAGMGVNVVQFVPPAPGQMQQEEMLEPLRAGMEAGAFGLSVRLPAPTEGPGSVEDLLALADAVADYDGVLAFQIEHDPEGFEELVGFADEVIWISRRAGVAAFIGPLTTPETEGGEGYPDLLQRMESAWEDGIQVWVVLDAHGSPGSPWGLLSGAPAWVMGEDGGDGALLDLPSAIHAMTGAPAGALRISDRGVLRPGAYADLVVMGDQGWAGSSAGGDSGGHADGIVHVLVNGEFTVRDGQGTEFLPGRVLNRRGADFARGATLDSP